MLTEVGQIRKTVIKTGLPRWLQGRESARQCRRCGFDPWVRKIPWRRKWQPTPVFFPGKSQEYRSLAGYISWVTKSQMPLRNWTTIIKSILSVEVRVCCNVSKKHLRLWNHIEMIVNLCSSLTSIFSTSKISKCWHLHTHLFNNLSQVWPQILSSFVIPPQNSPWLSIFSVLLTWQKHQNRFGHPLLKKSTDMIKMLIPLVKCVYT